jgi:hypothetical protein
MGAEVGAFEKAHTPGLLSPADRMRSCAPSASSPVFNAPTPVVTNPASGMVPKSPVTLLRELKAPISQATRRAMMSTRLDFFRHVTVVIDSTGPHVSHPSLPGHGKRLEWATVHQRTFVTDVVQCPADAGEVFGHSPPPEAPASSDGRHWVYPFSPASIPRLPHRLSHPWPCAAPIRHGLNRNGRGVRAHHPIDGTDEMQQRKGSVVVPGHWLPKWRALHNLSTATPSEQTTSREKVLSGDRTND